jgi:hypothetical protein
MLQSLTNIKRRPIEAILSGLLSDNPSESQNTAAKLIAEAQSFGIGLRDFLTLAVDVRGSANPERYQDGKGLLNGYHAALSFLKLPVKDDFENGITLDLASDTFQTYAGTRALFPEVIDDMVRWKYRQPVHERIDALVGSSRTINGVEMISTVVDDVAADYQVVKAVAELARVPVKSIRTTQNAVKFYKHGGGYRTSYEFSRRARLDMLTPYAARMNREMEMSKVGVATSLLINGDGVQAAAPVVAQSSYNAALGVNSTNNFISYKHLLAWLVARAQAGVPIDTVVGNWDAYLQWLLMFAVVDANAGKSDAEKVARAGFSMGGVPLVNGFVNFALSTTAPANRLIGYSKADTLEELVEAGSVISESETAIQNQSVTYVQTENTGYRLPFGDTRSIFNYGA